MNGFKMVMVLGLGMIAFAVQLAIAEVPMAQWFGYSLFGNVLTMVGYSLARDVEKLQEQEAQDDAERRGDPGRGDRAS